MSIRPVPDYIVFTNVVQLADKVKKLAGKTHKDRVNDFNTKLEALSEHHDIPKVSATGNLSELRLISSSIRLVLDKECHLTAYSFRSTVACVSISMRNSRWDVEWKGLGVVIVACLCNDLK
jgi:hypothetical protein